MKTLKLIAIASILAASCGGKKKEENKDTTTTTTTPPPADAAPAPPPPPPVDAAAEPTPVPTETADSVVVLAEHKDKKADDPVQVNFKKFAITKATFDPAKIEGGTATIELDATSIDSGKPMRDQHLAKVDYLNVPKFAKIVIDIGNVKKKAEKTFSAEAKVTAVGVTKKYPVTFDLVDAKDDWIKIKAEHKFKRSDFKIGKPQTDKDETVADDLTIKLQLTLKKT